MEFLIVLLLVSVLALAVGIYMYRHSEPFADLGLGEACNPEITDACGKEALCQADESGTKGLCFPKPTEEKEAQK
jgi:hypothetical protein